MGDREKGRHGADRRESAAGAAVKPQRRRAAPPHDLDITPQHVLRMAGAEGFHGGLLGGEPPSEMDRRCPPSHAVRDFAVGENALKESIAKSFHRRGNSRNVCCVEPKPDDVRHQLHDNAEMILPAPHSSFAWRTLAGGPVLVCEALETDALHYFTTRPWRLGRPASSADDSSVWGDVAVGVGVDLDCLIRPKQVHGRAVFVATPTHAPPEADIVVSARPELAVAVQTADCVPLLLVDRSSKHVAAAHAGWRGLAARVPAHAVAAMTREFGSKTEDLLVAAGPSIGACCYEVGRDVREAFVSARFSTEQIDRWFLDEPRVDQANPAMASLTRVRRPDHWFFDGWTSTRDQLELAGVPPVQIHLCGLCTASHAGVFCSYRRDGAPAGRMAGVVRSRTSGP